MPVSGAEPDGAAGVSAAGVSAVGVSAVGVSAVGSGAAVAARRAAARRVARPELGSGAVARPAANPARRRQGAAPCAPGLPGQGSGRERDAKRFAERALRAVLEALDGRRRALHLRDLADPEVVAALETYARTGGRERRLGAAVLERVRCAPGAHGRVEVFGRYRRGDRVFAVAACLRAHRGGWRLCALRVR
ncbi:Rv3235 family protein [Nocardia harenae]|uniref:Rv3235 family protein n=1 Tax=Nocardia harenae TaxID=358707 RepID=UPI00082E341B|nr:Rv3235 family protein [Nocardia harenae]